MAWDGTKAAGPILYQSGPYTTTNNGGADGYESFTMNTGTLSLLAGQQYVAFFSASNVFDGDRGTSRWGMVNDDYPGGEFVRLRNGSDFGAITTAPWTSVSNNDLAFRFLFSSLADPPDPPDPPGAVAAVPEPSSLLVWGLVAVCGTVQYVRSRRVRGAWRSHHTRQRSRPRRKFEQERFH